MVAIGLDVGGWDANAPGAVVADTGTVGCAIDEQFDGVASTEGAGDFTADERVELTLFAGVDDVVAGDGVNHERSLEAGRGCWRRILGVEGVVLQCGGGGATGAGDGAIDGGIAVGHQIGGRHEDAVVATGIDEAGVLLTIDGERDGVVGGKFAGNTAGNGDAAGAFVAANEVVGSDRVDDERGFG